jgi:glycogenin glucosyltransferase
MSSSSFIGPPRPKAIATFLSSKDFLPGCQCLLHSVNTHLPPTAKNEYPPEVIVLLSSKLKDDASITDRLRLFCTRIIEVEHIPINNDDDDAGENKQSHVKEWDENCGWTKLHLFGLDSYDTILYIDADCLVLKDISHLLSIDDDEDGGQTTTTTTHANKRRGLLAAAPDIFPPDKFNAGVMVLRPSKDVFDDMISRLPQQSSDDNTKCTSYDGGDTGFLNSYYPDWYSSWPVYSRLSFGYNAQRLMYHYTYQNRPQYWDEGIDSLYIVHFSSSPKPWKAMNSSSENEESANYLDGQDKNTIQRLKGGKLEHMWLAAYERSQKYFGKEKRKQLASAQSSKLKQAQAIQPETAPPAARSSPAQNNSKLFNKRFKELRASGMPIQEAMKKARVEYGLDKLDKIDPCQAVGQMFGLR